jgi:hypothetical protein
VRLFKDREGRRLFRCPIDRLPDNPNGSSTGHRALSRTFQSGNPTPSVLSSSREPDPIPGSTRAKEPPIDTPNRVSLDKLPLEERIRRRAYELYVERGNESGSDLDDWLQAKEEILWAEGDARVDEASEESFPASDSPAY